MDLRPESEQNCSKLLLLPQKGYTIRAAVIPSREEWKMLHWKVRAVALVTFVTSLAALGGLNRWW
jgi:hypothetical protein